MNYMGRVATAEEFVSGIESDLSASKRSTGSNLGYRTMLLDGPDRETVIRGLINNVPSYFDIVRVTKGGKAIASYKSLGIKKNLANCVVPKLNSHAFEKEMKILEQNGTVKHIVGRVEKINEATGDIRYHRVNIYAQSSAPDIQCISRGTIRKTMAKRIYDILPNCLDSNQNIGTSKWCAEQLGIDRNNKSAYGAVRGALCSMARDGVIKSRLSYTSRGENRRNPRIYWKE